MAIDTVWLGPLQTYQVGGWWLGTTGEPGAAALGFAYDSTTGEFARDQDGNAFHVAATVEASPADFLDTTDLRARLVTEIAVQFVALGAVPPGTVLTPIWTDWPASSP
ncbi:hypothetical protein [Nocardia farcinica]|uniref:hypothetical protein n=1 Tax=Nocardia farcinica TaxID=37329 RepID=UPI001893B39B|nr:hypothetical protein [Nocardia farcinica]MBF6189407.1 hypothetical protein [Nocardia farcinica]